MALTDASPRGELVWDYAIATYKDAEAVLHEALQIQHHLEAQDALLLKLTERFQDAKA